MKCYAGNCQGTMVYAGSSFKGDCDWTIMRCDTCARSTESSGHWSYPEPPSILFEMDRNMWCAKRRDFVNLQESPAGFGVTQKEAAADLRKAEQDVESENTRVERDDSHGQ